MAFNPKKIQILRSDLRSISGGEMEDLLTNKLGVSFHKGEPLSNLRQQYEAQVKDRVRDGVSFFLDAMDARIFGKQFYELVLFCWSLQDLPRGPVVRIHLTGGYNQRPVLAHLADRFVSEAYMDLAGAKNLVELLEALGLFKFE